MGATPGSIRNDRGRVSVWRVPNVLLEPRGSFLKRSDGLIAYLNRLRAVGGTLIAVGLAIYLSGVEGITGPITKGADGVPVITIGNGGLLGERIVATIITVMVSVLLLPLIGTVLVAMAKRGHRGVTLRRMGIPLLSIAVLGAFLVVVALLFKEANLGLNWLEQQHTAWVRLVGYVVGLAVVVVGLAWIVKAVYLAATGLLRADDAHPLLGPVASIGFAVIFVIIAIVNASGQSGFARLAGLGSGIVGFVVVVGMSLVTMWRLRKHYPQDFPFRTGPLEGDVAQAPDEPATRFGENWQFPPRLRKLVVGVVVLVVGGCLGFNAFVYVNSGMGDAAEPASATSFAGHWRGVQWGDEYVVVDGSTVRMIYGSNGGRVIGTADSSSVTGWWTQTPSRKPDQDAGEVSFHISGSGKDRVLLGTWRHSTSGQAQGWTAIWVDDAIPADSTAKFADAAAFVKHP